MTSDGNNGLDYGRLEEMASEAYEVMARELVRYNSQESLVYLKRYIHRKRAEGSYFFKFNSGIMGYHVFPFLAHMIVRHCTVLDSDDKVDDKVMEWLIHRYVAFPEALQLVHGKSNISKYRSEYLIRTAFEQFTVQEMNRTLVPRSLFLYQLIPESNPDRHRSFLALTSEVLEQQFRVNLDEVLLCTFALAVIAGSGDHFSSSRTTEVEWMKPYVESELFDIILSQLTLTRDEYIEASRGESFESFVYVKTEKHPIVEFPIVKYGDYYICPDPKSLMANFTRHLDRTVFDYFVKNDKIQEYWGRFGEVYKDYIGALLVDCYGTENVYDVDGMDGLQGKRADWLVVVGQDAAIIECKGLRFPSELRRTGSLDVMDSFVNDKIAKALDQVVATEHQWQVITQEIPEAANRRNIVKLIFVEENFQFANALLSFLPDNEVCKSLVREEIMFVSTLDLETVVTSNYAADFNSVFVKWKEKIDKGEALDQHLRALPGFCFVDDNILSQKFDEFFHFGE